MVCDGCGGALAHAEEFFKRLNRAIKHEFFDVLTICEASGVETEPIGFDHGGLGFDLKWDMAWVDRTLSYARLAHEQKKLCHALIADATDAAKNCVLPISHDEVGGGKLAFLDKMSGDYWQKFAGARAFLGYMMTIPGKKLNFMGYEIGHFREWSFDNELEWFLLEYSAHAKLQRFIAELDHFYLASSALWQGDGFEWISRDDAERSVLAYRRIAKSGEKLTVAVNFTPNVYKDFVLDVLSTGEYEEIFNSDDVRFGGSGVVNEGRIAAEQNGAASPSLKITLPPLAFVVIRQC